MKEVKQWVKARLAADEVLQGMIGGRVYSFRTGTEVPAPFVVATAFATDYALTRDGSFPDSRGFSLLCVASSNDEAVELADAVKNALSVGYIAASGELARLTREEERYDFEQQLFVTEITYILQ